MGATAVLFVQLSNCTLRTPRTSVPPTSKKGRTDGPIMLTSFLRAGTARQLSSNIRVPLQNVKPRGQPKTIPKPPTQLSPSVVKSAFLNLYPTLVKGLRDMTCDVVESKNHIGTPTIEVRPHTHTHSGMKESLEGTLLVVGIAEDNASVVTLQSPASNGMYRYTYNEQTHQFIAEDRHELIGMLCRDLLWNCKGMPKF